MEFLPLTFAWCKLIAFPAPPVSVSAAGVRPSQGRAGKLRYSAGGQPLEEGAVVCRMMAVLCLSAGVGIAAAGEADAVEKRSTAAEAESDAKTAKFQAVAAFLGEQEKKAREAGNKAVIDHVKAESQASDEGQEPPKAAPPELNKEEAAANSLLGAAYLATAKGSAAVEKRLAALRTEPAADSRKKWVHVGGTFTTTQPGEWEERAPDGATHQFKEISRTEDCIEMQHVKGTSRVRLYKDRCDVGFRPFTTFKTYYSGGWAK